MPILKSKAAQAPEPETQLVNVRVTKRGHGMVSTGVHHALGGEECFSEGEEFVIERDLAEVLADENGERRYVTILGPVKKTLTLDKAS